MSGESEKLFVKMDIDMSDFDSAVDKMNEKLKALKSAFANAERSLGARKPDGPSGSALAVLTDALSGVSADKNVDVGDAENNMQDMPTYSSKDTESIFKSNGDMRFMNVQTDTAAIIRREVENEFARQASKIARI